VPFKHLTWRSRHGVAPTPTYERFIPIPIFQLPTNCSKANFAIFKHLLLDADGLFSVDCDDTIGSLHVRVDRSKIPSHGKASISRILHQIHIWRCTADVTSCKALYEPLSTVNSQYEVWRKIVASQPEAPWKFVQANTILGEDGQVELKVYEESNEGIIQSFVDRKL
jgi:dipeptidyl-peptidase III